MNITDVSVVLFLVVIGLSAFFVFEGRILSDAIDFVLQIPLGDRHN